MEKIKHKTYVPSIMFELSMWAEDTLFATHGEIKTNAQGTTFDSDDHREYVLEQSSNKKQLSEDWDTSAEHEMLLFKNNNIIPLHIVLFHHRQSYHNSRRPEIPINV